MTIFVSISDKCKQQAEEHAQLQTLLDIASNIESQQSVAILDKHQPWPILKKCSGRFRAYAVEQLYQGGAHRIVRFATFFIKATCPDFHKKIEDDRDFRERFVKESSLTEDELNRFVEEKLRAGVREPEPPTQTELSYLNQNFTEILANDTHVYETLDWVDQQKARWMEEFRRTLAGVLTGLYNTDRERRKLATRYPANVNEHGVLYRQFNAGLLLIAAVGFPDGAREEDLRKKYREVLEINEGIDEDNLRKFSIRAYPEYILCDENIWVTLQKSGRDANLSLSPEELKLLCEILKPDAQKPYPLFINGRPGSGKSTVLHYLFAEFLHHHLKTPEPLPHPPLYLTYSESLVERAKEAVLKILACDYRRIENPPDIDSQHAQATIKKAFQSFRGLLVSLLSPGQQERFAINKYVDYPEFRKRWMRSLAQSTNVPANLRQSPELCWHAIRTFIKGRCNVGGGGNDGTIQYFHPEQYEELPRKQKSIDEDSFRNIYEKVWKGWYQSRCAEEGLWDDQDLALAVLQEKNLATYPAIVCDEAQDFTANELAVIFRLSLFSARRMANYQFGKIPFAFAGDPLQTLNPTGFDWGGLSESFKENLLRELDPDGSHQLTVNFRELEFNYRSAEPIVKITNLIQLLRGILFDVRGLRPQQTWRCEHSRDPEFFRIEDAATRDALRKMRDLVFIVPSQDESELVYAKEDTQLRDIVFSGENLLRDVFNPMRSKGLEFGRVVVYKFGAYCLESWPELSGLLSDPKRVEGGVAERLKYEYFVNRMYVSLSRARSRLLIVDTSDAIERFWSFAKGYAADDLIRRYASAGWEPKHLGIIIEGNVDTLKADVVNDDADVGQQYFDAGLASRDPYLLERAAKRFEVARDEVKALTAEAWAYHYREAFAQAADSFERIPDVENAIKNFWLAGEYARLLQFARGRRVANDPRYVAAQYMSSVRQETDARVFFKALSDIAFGKSSDEFYDARMREALDDGYKQLVARLEHSPGDELVQTELVGCVSYVEQIAMQWQWTPVATVGYAVLLARAGKKNDATRVWKETRKPLTQAPRIVLEALAATAPFPESLESMERLGDFNGIIALGRSVDWLKVPSDGLHGLAKSFWEKASEEQFMAFARVLPRSSAMKVLEVIPVAVRQSNARISNFAGELLLDLARTGDLQEYMSWLVGPRPPGVSEQLSNWVKSVASKASGLHRDALRALANHAFESKDIQASLRDSIDRYFDPLIKGRSKELAQVSPFEVGAILELSGKFRTMQSYYDMVHRGRDRLTDPQIIEFVRERLLFAKVGLASVTESVAKKRQIQSEIEKEAREWAINRNTIPSHISLGRYQSAIEQFYRDCFPATDGRVASRNKLQGSVQERSVATEDARGDWGLPLGPEQQSGPPVAKKPLGTAMSNADCSGSSAPVGGSAGTAAVPAVTGRAAEEVIDRALDRAIVSFGASKLEVSWDYGLPRVEIRNLATRESVVIRKSNLGQMEVRSVDIEVERVGDERFRLDQWGIEVQLTPADGTRTRIEVGITTGLCMVLDV